MIEEVKQCPSCGHQPSVYRGLRHRYSVGCERCNNRTKTYFKLEDAITAWNRRINEQGKDN